MTVDGESIIYPAMRVNWYPGAERHPSLVDGTGHCALREQLAMAAAEAAARPAPNRRGSAVRSNGGGHPSTAMKPLVVSVVNAQGLVPASDGVTSSQEVPHFCVSAFYQGEPQVVADQRRSQPCQATLSASRSSRYDCTLDKSISIPYNDRQQFVKVAVYMHSPERGDETLVGEATVPIADPNVASVSRWSLMNDFVEKGTVYLSVQIPSMEDPETPQQTTPPTASAPSSAVFKSSRALSPRSVCVEGLSSRGAVPNSTLDSTRGATAAQTFAASANPSACGMSGVASRCHAVGSNAGSCAEVPRTALSSGGAVLTPTLDSTRGATAAQTFAASADPSACGMSGVASRCHAVGRNAGSCAEVPRTAASALGISTGSHAEVFSERAGRRNVDLRTNDWTNYFRPTCDATRTIPSSCEVSEVSPPTSSITDLFCGTAAKPKVASRRVSPPPAQNGPLADLSASFVASGLVQALRGVRAEEPPTQRPASGPESGVDAAAVECTVPSASSMAVPFLGHQAMLSAAPYVSRQIAYAFGFTVDSPRSASGAASWVPPPTFPEAGITVGCTVPGGPVPGESNAMSLPERGLASDAPAPKLPDPGIPVSCEVVAGPFPSENGLMPLPNGGVPPRPNPHLVPLSRPPQPAHLQPPTQVVTRPHVPMTNVPQCGWMGYHPGRHPSLGPPTPHVVAGAGAECWVPAQRHPSYGCGVPLCVRPRPPLMSSALHPPVADYVMGVQPASHVSPPQPPGRSVLPHTRTFQTAVPPCGFARY
eukprot:TRINITY_DN18866_c0_g1_i1.p1 TRINITY_DN18866_c0_g1~~TRINITY_DN18866_c0_g1_i1.p1  ORF type:complete len:766 (+),score=100.74 TRINITY_DN18866_c0_g1_i1:249-2546(+)